MIVDKQCEVCHIGILDERQTTYIVRFQGGLLFAPGIKAWLCDVCGSQIYDSNEIGRIEMLLGMDTGVTGPVTPTRITATPGDLMTYSMTRRRSV